MDENNKEEIIDNSNNIEQNNKVDNVDIQEDGNAEINKKVEREGSKQNNQIIIEGKKNVLSKFKTKESKKVLLITLITMVVLFIAFGILVCINKLNENVYNNIYIFNTNVGGYSSSELKAFLEDKNKIEFDGQIKILQDTEVIYTVLESDAQLKLDVTATTNKIMAFGRTGNIFVDNFNIVKALISKKNIEPEYTYNDEKLNDIIKNADLSIKDRMKDNKISIDEDNKKLVITIGTSGNGIDYEKEKNQIINILKTNYEGSNNDKKIYLNIIKKSPDKLNVKEIYDKVKREPKDAYIDRNSNPIKLVSEVVGLDIDINKLTDIVEKNKNIKEGEAIEIELNVIQPKVKLEDLNSELYNDKIAGYTTYFDPSQYARANNLKIALDYLNGKVIMPGEVFSYNDAIGDTTVAKGYQPAATFMGGKTVNEVGGGICQTTSTLYNVALMANLEIVERHQHGLPVGYVQPSRDATVYSPNLDFKFKNTRSNPIKIVTSFSSGGNLNVSLYGIKEAEEYEVELISQYLSTIPFSTKYIYDPNMEQGKQVVVTNGVNGYTSQCFIRKKLNGVQVSYDLLSKDTYNPQQQVVRVGTKGVQNNVGS